MDMETKVNLILHCTMRLSLPQSFAAKQGHTYFDLFFSIFFLYFRYRGKKEGLITENANYYLFTQQVDGSFHAIPVDSWYSFQQSIRHSTLNAEEAEEEFNRLDSVISVLIFVAGKVFEKTMQYCSN